MNILKYIVSVVFIVFVIGCEDEKLDIEKYGKVTGTIIDGDDYRRLGGVQVATNPASTAAITDDDGTFVFEKVGEGELAITAKTRLPE